MQTLAKRLSIRFARAFCSGAIAVLALITVQIPATWSEVPNILSNLALAALIGGITGVIQAGDLYFRNAK